MTTQTERDRFEQAALAHFLARREAGLAIDDNGSPATAEALFWKDEAGNYGVKMFNAAWWGWQAALKVHREVDTLLSESVNTYRVWPDGTVQDVEDGVPYSWMSDDYALVQASSEEDAAVSAKA